CGCCTSCTPTDLHLPPVKNIENLVVSSDKFRELFKDAQCKECGGDYFVSVKNKGIDSIIELDCLCEKSKFITPPTTTPTNPKACLFSQNNLSLVLHSLLSNQGYNGFCAMAASLKRPALASHTYESHVQYIFKRMEKHYSTTIKESHEAVRQHYT
ncbi:hypothetical protein Pcinc_014910, partial [Petrolisthes cinctipes]